MMEPDDARGSAGAIVALQLHPTNHLRTCADDGTWEAVGNDPAFHCALPAGGLAPGWYEVDMALELLQGPQLWSYFYPDYGDPELERHKVFVPLSEVGGGRQRAIVLFTNHVQRLRFDPAVAVCKFRLGGLRLRRMGRREAAGAMLRDVLGSLAPGVGEKLRRVASLARQLLTGGASAFAARLYSLYSRAPEGSANVGYQTWIDLYDPCSPEVLDAAGREAAALAVQPLFSIIVPVYDTHERWLRKCVASVRRQVYGNWELCLSDDASPSPHVRRLLDELSAQDPRIKVVHREQNGHISAASNSAIEEASGDWLVLLDHDDELHPVALAEVAGAINRFPHWKLIFSDEDKIDENGRRFDPYMKSDWNYDLFLSHNCISHLGAYDAALVREVGGFRVGIEGSQDWDLALRCIERLRSDQVGHIPKVLYHWRAIKGSTALAPQEKGYAHHAGLRAIAEHLERTSSSGRVEEIPGQHGNYRVRYAVPDPAPLVSIIIPTRDKVELLKACIDSIVEKTTYPAYEIVVVDNQSSQPDALEYLASLGSEPRVRVIAYDEPFNYSLINNRAAAAARGTVLCLLNNDITVISPDWLEEMVGHACRPGVGAVGAMLYYPNDTIQHAGVIVGAHGVAAHAYSGHGRGYPGHMSRARLIQELSAVTAACMVVTREAFERVGGLDPLLNVAFNDVDFCLRLREAGYRNVWTPYPELYHHESATRGYETSPEKMERFNGEVVFMRNRWGEALQYDPAYNRNLSVNDELYQLAFPPREKWPGPQLRALDC
ncbi:glycosyltransferase family 2 protein [Luteimonas sp. MC1828]|uniref:glycosyltransferase family 2 protein n=1 Tax=Luteimonas sp. MC1828 TaxID=2799787 RepID=UPI001F356598|nr:glycosyltransferase family 2 protein [Luteimonas sp. MC1828]